MTRIIKVFFWLLLVSSAACAQTLPNDIMLGEWRYIGGPDQEGMIECPDVLVLTKDGKYEILNDCYGDDILSPIVETGKWMFEKDENRITLDERNLKMSYAFIEKSKTLTGYIKAISENEMTVCFGSKGNCTEELYRRINP